MHTKIKKGYSSPQADLNQINLNSLFCGSFSEAEGESNDTYTEQEWGGTWN